MSSCFLIIILLDEWQDHLAKGNAISFVPDFALDIFASIFVCFVCKYITYFGHSCFYLLVCRESIIYSLECLRYNMQGNFDMYVYYILKPKKYVFIISMLNGLSFYII